MSLISQKDREMVIDALEFYIQDMKKNNCNEAAIYSYNNSSQMDRIGIFQK